VKAALYGLVLAVLVGWGQAAAKIAVSPVLHEEARVQAGQRFAVTCHHRGEEPLEVEASLALFDQDAWGKAVFLDDQDSVARAEQLLSVHPRRFWLEPGAKEVVQVEVVQDSFEHLYAVLFLKPVQSSLQTRLAVLFLLSTGSGEAALDVASWAHRGEALTLQVENSGGSHGLWAGELLLFDGDGRLGDTMQVRSGVVLPGRSRGLEVSLPSWVEKVEIRPLQFGGGP